MPSFELMTAKVVDRVGGKRLMHFPADKSRYYQKDEYGAVSYFGKYGTNKAAKAMWRGELRSRGYHV